MSCLLNLQILTSFTLLILVVVSADKPLYANFGCVARFLYLKHMYFAF
uniref:Uncharacterized protein n=1 Tax=Triticum urartu TaxID=4572 RepID=A0A8R7PA55_TRIUA